MISWQIHHIDMFFLRPPDTYPGRQILEPKVKTVNELVWKVSGMPQQCTSARSSEIMTSVMPLLTLLDAKDKNVSRV